MWLPLKLGDLLSLEYGKALARPLRTEHGSVVVAGSNGSDGFHDLALVKGPGIVVGRKGSAGKVTWIDSDFWPIDTTFYVEHDSAVTNIRWLYHLLQSKKLERLNKATGVPGLTRNDAYAEPCLLPPPTEQARIAALLDEVDGLRVLQREADTQIARLRSALFLKTFGDPIVNPNKFRKKRLAELIRLKSGNFLPAKDMAPDGAFAVYGGNGVNGRHDQYMFEEPAVILGRVGVYCGAVHYSEPKAWITDNALYVSEKLLPLEDQYLVAALEQANLNQYAGRAGQPLISGNRIYPVEILVPPQELQLEFSKSVADLQTLDVARANASTRLDTLWDVLMSRAFSGHLTAKWRADHIEELLAEMEEQARALGFPLRSEAEVQP
jgi:type I restriction enzyme S subunit